METPERTVPPLVMVMLMLPGANVFEGPKAKYPFGF
jgi:hypothetical protein